MAGVGHERPSSSAAPRLLMRFAARHLPVTCGDREVLLLGLTIGSTVDSVLQWYSVCLLKLYEQQKFAFADYSFGQSRLTNDRSTIYPVKS